MFFCLWKLFYNHFITFSNQVPSCQQQEQQQQQTREALATTKITTTSEKWLQKFSWHTPAARGKGSQDEAARRMADCQDAEDNNSLSVSVVCLNFSLSLSHSLSANSWRLQLLPPIDAMRAHVLSGMQHTTPQHTPHTHTHVYGIESSFSLDNDKNGA